MTGYLITQYVHRPDVLELAELYGTIQIDFTVYLITKVVKPSCWRTVLRYLKIRTQPLGSVRLKYSHTTIDRDQLN